MDSENSVREIRVREGLTQRELADLARLSAKTISRMENGDDSVLEQTKHKVVKGLNKLDDKRREYTFEDVFKTNGS